MDRIVYIAGPYSQGDVAVNVRKAIKVGMQFNDLGDYAIIPHLSHFLHLLDPREYNYWLKLDRIILPKCDTIYRIPGPSKGADKEMELAKKWGLKIQL